MQKWEYLMKEYIYQGDEDQIKMLNELGELGWQLTHNVQQRYYFKRPLPPETTATKIFNEVKNEVEGGHMEVKTTS